ncbi:hypothetical protein [Pseudomonas sp. R1-1]|uniref:hypothetical protein n=1 Tax=Pseudomonas sp. R1-1 TaxID=1602529 RepID=UPI003DA8F63B
MDQHTPCLGLLRRQTAEQFVLQVIQQRVDTLPGLKVLRPVALLQKQHAHAGAPTAGALDNASSDSVGLIWRQVTQHRRHFIARQRKAGALTFKQFVIKQKARPVALRSTASADPPAKRRTADREQAIQ